MKPSDLRLVETCGACTEQYDVFLDDKKVGYLRLRGGYFRADVPECGDESIYNACPEGDGCFEDHERKGFLAKALSAIAAHYSDKDGQTVSISQDELDELREKAWKYDELCK